MHSLGRPGRGRGVKLGLGYEKLPLAAQVRRMGWGQQLKRETVIQLMEDKDLRQGDGM